MNWKTKQIMELKKIEMKLNIKSEVTCLKNQIVLRFKLSVSVAEKKV